MKFIATYDLFPCFKYALFVFCFAFVFAAFYRLVYVIVPLL